MRLRLLLVFKWSSFCACSNTCIFDLLALVAADWLLYAWGLGAREKKTFTRVPARPHTLDVALADVQTKLKAPFRRAANPTGPSKPLLSFLSLSFSRIPGSTAMRKLRTSICLHPRLKFGLSKLIRVHSRDRYLAIYLLRLQNLFSHAFHAFYSNLVKINALNL